MAYCGKCGYDYESGIVVCPDCGESLIEGDRVECPQCGEQIVAAVTTCPHCGVLLGWGPEKEADMTCSEHPGRDAIGCCIICGIPLCPECSRKRQGKIFCEKDLHLKVAFNWISAYSTTSSYEAEMVKANLQSANIPVTILSQNDRMYITTLGDLAVTEVMVPKELFEKAQAFIKTLTPDVGDH